MELAGAGCDRAADLVSRGAGRWRS